MYIRARSTNHRIAPIKCPSIVSHAPMFASLRARQPTNRYIMSIFARYALWGSHLDDESDRRAPSAPAPVFGLAPGERLDLPPSQACLRPSHYVL